MRNVRRLNTAITYFSVSFLVVLVVMALVRAALLNPEGMVRVRFSDAQVLIAVFVMAICIGIIGWSKRERSA